jgi:hypothetical protein
MFNLVALQDLASLDDSRKPPSLLPTPGLYQVALTLDASHTFHHNYSTNCKKSVMTPYGMIALIFLLGFCTLVALLPSQARYDLVTWCCCDLRTTPD